MSADDIREKVKEIVAKVAGVELDEIDDHHALSDIEDIDSLSRIEILVEMEREFKLETPEDPDEQTEWVNRIQTIDDAVEMVEQLYAESA